MSISLDVATVVGGAVTLTTAIFWGAFFLGDYRRRLMSLEERVDRHVSDLVMHRDRRQFDGRSERNW